MEISLNLEHFAAVMYPRIVGSLSLLCGDRELAEDLAQEAFTKLCRDWWRVRRMDQPEAWLYKVAINLSNSHFRRARVATKVQKRLESLEIERTNPAPEVATALRAAIEDLPKRQRAALVLRYYADLPYAQIAQLMGVKESTAKSMVRQAVRRLRTDEVNASQEEVSGGLTTPN